MKFYNLALLSLLSAAPAWGQNVDGDEDCSGQNNRFQAPRRATGRCMDWEVGVNSTYPDDFGGIFNEVKTYTCVDSKKRIMISNNIPDHTVTLWRDANPCEILMVVELPLNPDNPDPIDKQNPDLSKLTEVPIRGMIAMAKNGVPAFGPQESDGLNALENDGSSAFDAGYWYGHPGGNNGWHVHNPKMGIENVDSETFLGWSMDGFKIFGPLSDDSVLDQCNGRLVDGVYQYHVRTISQVDETVPYCDGDSPITRWNYIFGCYAGDITNTVVTSSVNYVLPSDCVLESYGSCTDNPEYNCASVAQNTANRCVAGDEAMIECPATCQNTECASWDDDSGDDGADDGGDNNGGDDDDDDDDDGGDVTNPTKKPNIIIIQPDDLIFMDEWGRPPYNGEPNVMPSNGDDMPYIEDLRENGLQMLQAYTASPMCGTSRYSTITGKMPSRSESIRVRWNDEKPYPAEVTIPGTKLLDSVNQRDCSAENLAAVFGASDDYETAMIGKWHLSRLNDETYSYPTAVETVEACGFDTVGALYVENLQVASEEFNSFSDGSFSHNLEWLAYEAIEFINNTVADDKSFFMYFNPTVPHNSGNVREAINDYTCQMTANRDFTYNNDGNNGDPWIKGMSEDGGCEEYRETIRQRAQAAGDVYNLGPIWLDDAIGALVNALIDNGVYDDTIIVFQEDHGMDNKEALYEGGTRIPQFIHYPNGIRKGTFNAPVSTVDLAPTLMEYAGLTQTYQTDGTSWKQAVEDAAMEESWRTDRCLFFEGHQDRSVRCGCYKYVDIENDNDEDSPTWRSGGADGLVNELGGVLFDLCDGGDSYVTDPTNHREAEVADNESMKAALAAVLECHLDNTNPNNDPAFGDCSHLLDDIDDSEDDSESPSASPTASPSASPTASPSASPTASPSASPTASPSASPTASPSEAPTKSPTEEPTDATESPTESSVVCEDDATYFYRRRDCASIAMLPSRRKDDWCSRPDRNDASRTVSSFCPVACDACDEIDV